MSLNKMSASAMDTVETSWHQLYQHSLTVGLERLLSSEKLSDVTIEAGSYTFKCHKVILSCLSPYFEAMFSSGMKESITGLVKIEGIDGKIFKGILSYIYSGTNILQESNAEEVLKGAALLQIDCLEQECEKFLSRSLSVSNCIALWRLAHSHSCVNLSQKAWSYMMDHFVEVSKLDEFLLLEAEELLKMLKDDHLHAADEEFILDTAIRWVSFDEVRTQHLPAIFKSVRLSLARPQFLVDIVRKHSMIRNCQEVLQTIDKAKNFQLLPSRRHDFISEEVSPKKAFTVGGCVGRDIRQ